MSAQRVCALAYLEQDMPLRVEPDGVPITVIKDSEGVVHAIGDTCTHGDISLAEGFVENDAIECWAHGSQFSLATGKPLNLPAYEPVPVFDVTVDDSGVVYIDPANKTLAS